MAHTQRHLVIVVGAGMAGLSAAQHLAARGLTDLLVLEAGNRIGGRIHSVSFGADDTSVVELGASIIEGTTHANSALVLANERGLLDINPDKFHRRKIGYFYRPDGSVIGQALSQRIWETFQTWAENPEPERIYNVQEYFSRRLNQAFVKGVFTTREREDVEAIFTCFLEFMSVYLGASLSDVSLKPENADDMPGGIQRVSGMAALVNALRDDLHQGQLKLGHQVTRISLDNGELQLECSNGTRFVADHVIVTCSLGYLKQQAATLFAQPLPPGHMTAINRIGFGKLGKIFLQYDRPFWTKGDVNVKFAWPLSEKKKKSDADWYKSIWRMDEVTATENILGASVAFDDVDAMEREDDETVKVVCTQLLRKFLQNPSIPMPNKILKSSWSTNPLFRGSYSYLANATRLEDFETLATPIARDGIPRILFAGEANSGFGCIHNARDSGLRQAEVILACRGLSLAKL